MFADKIINFNRTLVFSGKLPKGIDIMNPFRDSPEAVRVSELFYKKFYSDDNRRKIILGINPGRLGGGVTGVPFTDSKRLAEECGIVIHSVKTHEPSSVFIYDMIRQFGGPEKFYGEFYINSVCPLGFIEESASGKWNNLNYYDYPSLIKTAEPFILEQLKRQIALGVDASRVYILGKKNAEFFKTLNEKYNFFQSMVVLDHPRYIVQYRSKYRDEHIQQYLKEFEQHNK